MLSNHRAILYFMFCFLKCLSVYFVLKECKYGGQGERLDPSAQIKWVKSQWKRLGKLMSWQS